MSHDAVEYISFWSDMQGEFLPMSVRKVLAVARVKAELQRRRYANTAEAR